MSRKNALAAFVTLSFLSPLAFACGDARQATAEPEPTEPVDVADFERDLPASETVPEEIGAADAACRAPLAEPFIGETMNLETRQALLDAVEPQVKIRVVEPDMEVLSEDLVNDRLNIRTDEDDTIVEVYCG